jgi:Fe-S cluster assembly protein SufB
VEFQLKKAIALIVNGFSKEVLNKLPMEFAVVRVKSLEGSVGKKFVI